MVSRLGALAVVTISISVAQAHLNKPDCTANAAHVAIASISNGISVNEAQQVIKGGLVHFNVLSLPGFKATADSLNQLLTSKQKEIARGLTQSAVAARKSELKRALQDFEAGLKKGTLTHDQLMRATSAISVALESTQAPAKLAPILFEDGYRGDMYRAADKNLLYVPIIRDEPLSQEEILLYMAGGLYPCQLVTTKTFADGKEEGSWGFLRHDYNHSAALTLSEFQDLNPPYKPLANQSPENYFTQRQNQMKELITKIHDSKDIDPKFTVALLFDILHEGYYPKTDALEFFLPPDPAIMKQAFQSPRAIPQILSHIQMLDRDEPHKRKDAILRRSLQLIAKLLNEILP